MLIAVTSSPIVLQAAVAFGLRTRRIASIREKADFVRGCNEKLARRPPYALTDHIHFLKSSRVVNVDMRMKRSY